jgi:arylsulfatase
MKAALLLLLLVSAGLLFRLDRAADRTPLPGWKPRLVILLCVDTLRADHLGCYGYPRPTSPAIDRMASEGVLFENAFSQGNRTQLSFTSLLTGTYVAEVRADRSLPPDRTTLASLLASYGIRTLASVAGGHLNHAFGFNRGFDEYEDKIDFASFHSTLPYAIRWLHEVARNPRPTFVFLHGYDVHSPYHKPLVFDRMYAPGYEGPARGVVMSGVAENKIWDGRLYDETDADASLPATRRLAEAHAASVALAPADVDAVTAGYDGAISYADLYVARLLDEVRRVGLERDTLVILIGDHGEQLLEKGFQGHGLDLDDRELHVPLVMWGPGGIAGGRRVRDVVELVDVFPTVADFFAIRADTPGTSLRARALGLPLSQKGPGRGGGGSALSACAAGRALRTADYRLVVAAPRQATGGYEVVDGLYSASDPAARHNLIGRPEMAAVARSLLEELETRWKSVAQ